MLQIGNGDGGDQNQPRTFHVFRVQFPLLEYRITIVQWGMALTDSWYLPIKTSKCYIKDTGARMSKPLVYLPSNPSPSDKVAKLTPEMFERRLKDMTEAIESLRFLERTMKHPAKAR